MCTAIVGFDPAARVPLFLAGVRDELADRAWHPPARHWPGHPGLVGGRDDLAGGTWLALDPAAPRVACVLNGLGRPAPEERRRSRGELPLLLAATGTPAHDLRPYDPFHLVGADAGAVRLWSWDGERLVERELEPGLHIVVNSGLAVPGTRGGDDFMSARVAHFRPRFEAAGRDRASWLRLLGGDGLDPSDDRALIVRRDLEDGRVWGTTSISLTTFGPDGTVGYDFTAAPGDPGAWQPIPLT
jgi:Transport and Golgi organisation 2